MSSSRKNWSTLSSLAQQWSAEDEEELERERRRRHRQLSSTSETKEEEASSPGHNATSQTPNRFHNSLEAKPFHLENSKLKNEKAQEDTINKLEGKKVRRKAEFFNNWKQDQKTPFGVRKFQKEPAEENPVFPSEPPKEKLTVGKCEKQIQRKDLTTGEQHNQLQNQKKETITLRRCEPLNHEKDLKTDIDQVSREKQKASNACDSQRLAVVQDEVSTQQAQRASRKSISRLEVKIQPRARNFTEDATATPPETPQATERTVPKTDAKTLLGQDESEVPVIVSQPQITYSSSFNRISPRTISFRVVSRKDKQDDTLNRSASMRLPASTSKLEEKLERYTSAVQRAGSIKVSPSVRRNYQLASEGVASKRSIFEATVPVRNEPPTLIRKESLKFPGRVSSRINLWISQESSKNERAKDIQETENTTQQSPCGK